MYLKNTTTRTGRRLSLESSFRACLTISETNPEPGLSTMSAGGVPFSVILLPMFTLAEEREAFRLSPPLLKGVNGEQGSLEAITL
jgi:hypothetical protein